jgi:hypothetical protein
MASIPDITETEMWVTRTTLKERYGRDMEIQVGDADIRLHPSDRELTPCPLLFWQSDDGCHFVVFKTGGAATGPSSTTSPTSRWAQGLPSMTTSRSASSPRSRPRRTMPPSGAAI